jgi:tRNA pseudouridine55 synthase
VAAACRALAGTRLQAPPAYSAKRVEGRRSYELARRGIAVEPRVVAVTLHSIELLAVDGERVEIEVRCSPGTYIRALARDLGEALATGGHLVTLRRMRSGAFGLERAVGWDAPFEDALTPLSQLLPEIPAAVLTDSGVEALRHGRDLPRDLVRSGFPDAPVPRMRVLDSSGALLGLAVPRGFGRAGPGLSIEPVLHPDVVLVD